MPNYYGGCGPCCCGGGSGGGNGWPNLTPCNCCGSTGMCWPASSSANATITETITTPCCANGDCSACGNIACDAPWLQPKAVGCGRTHKCNMPWKFALHEDELDQADLPGRPPHTIVCVRAKGKTHATVVEELMCGPNVPDSDPCNSYDLYLCVYIPVEIIIRDCVGFLYCLTSAMSQIVRIPLTTRVRNLKDTQIYLKARVRLCKTQPVEYPNTTGSDLNINHPPTAQYDEDDEDDNSVTGCPHPGRTWSVPTGTITQPPKYDPTAPGGGGAIGTDDDIAMNVGCGNLGYAPSTGHNDGFGSATPPGAAVAPRALPEVRLDLLIEACVMRLVPFGIVGDPSAAATQSTATFVGQ